MTAEIQPLRRRVNRGSAHQPRQTFRKLPCVPVRKRFEKMFARDQAENAVAQEFETLIINSAAEFADATGA